MTRLILSDRKAGRRSFETIVMESAGVSLEIWNQEAGIARQHNYANRKVKDLPHIRRLSRNAATLASRGRSSHPACQPKPNLRHFSSCLTLMLVRAYKHEWKTW